MKTKVWKLSWCGQPFVLEGKIFLLAIAHDCETSLIKQQRTDRFSVNFVNVNYGKWLEPRGTRYLFGMIIRVRVVVRKMTTAQVVKASVTTNSLSKDY